MQRRIEIDGLTYICNVSHTEDTEWLSCSNGEEVAEFLKNNGVVVNDYYHDGFKWTIEIDRTRYNFMGEEYWVLNQCEGDLFEWFNDAMCGDFTYYYDKIVFCTSDGFIAAYRNDITNTIKI